MYPLDPEPLSPAAQLLGSVRQTAADLLEVTGMLPGLDDEEREHRARILERLSEELAEAAVLTRALPGRPVRTSAPAGPVDRMSC